MKCHDCERYRKELRSAKGMYRRTRKRELALIHENAKLRLQAPMQDMLLVVIRLSRQIFEGVSELLDKRVEQTKVETKGGPK